MAPAPRPREAVKEKLEGGCEMPEYRSLHWENKNLQSLKEKQSSARRKRKENKHSWPAWGLKHKVQKREGRERTLIVKKKH